MRETVLSFDCDGERLAGIVAEPVGTTAEIGVLIVVGGPQYRAGSHRQFVLLARHLAARGVTSLRFDYRGMGDSTGDTRDFKDAAPDIQAAVSALLTSRSALKHVVIWGLCDAASAALMYVESTRDPRVAGLTLLNPWVRSAETLAKAHVQHYYWRRLREKAFWMKLLRGGVGVTALKSFTQNLRLARGAGQASPDTRSFQDRMMAGLKAFDGPVLLVLSGDDYTAKEFSAWAQDPSRSSTLASLPLLESHALADADHTLSASGDQQAMCSLVEAWLQTRWPNGRVD